MKFIPLEKLFLLGILLCSTFWACGESSSTEQVTQLIENPGLEIFENIEALPNCTVDNAGVQYFVKENGKFYGCTGSFWEVLNGGMGEPGTGCSVLDSNAVSVTIACGEDVFVMNLKGDTGAAVTAPSESIELASISGVSQKGPFVKGSKVYVYELANGKTLSQTSRTFIGSIQDENGLFTIMSVSLRSQYALLEANGYYRNEVTGNTSASPISLFALTDLMDRERANINLLTHLEYHRARHLILLDGESFAKARMGAAKNVFAAFYVDNATLDSPEDLNIFSAGEGNAALLAISIMLQRNLSEGEFSNQLMEVGTDLADDGKWSNTKTRAEIADWAYLTSLGENGETSDTISLAKLRENVESWKLHGSDSVPAFEKYIRNFWALEYGLGECNAKTANAVKHDTASNSVYYASEYADVSKSDVRFICDGSTGLWRKATDIEKDTVGMGHGFKNGDVRFGIINKKQMYVYEDENWRQGTSFERNIGRSCTKYSKPDTMFSSFVDLVCESGVWKPLKGEMTYAGQTYKTVRIGDQLWMAENLNYNPGDVSDLGDDAWHGCYGNKAENCAAYGRLYSWNVASVACPEGWHLPTRREVEKMLGVTSGFILVNGGAKTEDQFGFSLLMAGNRYYFGDFYGLGESAYLWTSSVYPDDDSSYYYLEMSASRIDTEFSEHKMRAFSVRCLKDPE